MFRSPGFWLERARKVRAVMSPIVQFVSRSTLMSPISSISTVQVSGSRRGRVGLQIDGRKQCRAARCDAVGCFRPDVGDIGLHRGKLLEFGGRDHFRPGGVERDLLQVNMCGASSGWRTAISL